jgi:hypothetical protein
VGAIILQVDEVVQDVDGRGAEREGDRPKKASMNAAAEKLCQAKSGRNKRAFFAH